MNRITNRLWQHANVKRVVAIGAVVAICAFFLFVFLASLGDRDLPPYDPPFPGERAGWTILAVVAWPLILAARIMGRDPPFVLWLPLLFLAGLFWALLVEVCIMKIHARKAYPASLPRRQ